MSITRESARLVDVQRQFRDCICSTQVRALEGGSSTTKQILIDQDLRGWKEVEYEVRFSVPSHAIDATA